MSRNYYKGSGFQSNASMATENSNGKRMIFFTEFHFNALGVVEFRMALDKKLREGELEAYHEWVESSQAFRIRCVPGDAWIVSSIFRVMLAEFIKNEIKPPKLEDDEEDEEDSEIIELAFNSEERLASNKIQRLAVYKNDLAQQSQSAAINPRHSKPVSPELPLILALPKELHAFKYKEMWSCANDKENLDFIVSNKMLVELGQLTGCQFMKNLVEGKVLVAGHSEEDCHRAMLKLDNIRKYCFPQGCHTNHLFYSENSENVQFVLKLFRHINKKLFKSTILDNLHVHIHKGISDYETLFEAVRLRCAPYNQKKSLFVAILENHNTPPIKVSNQQPGLKDWAGFEYSSRGDPDQCPARISFSGSVPINAPPMLHETQQNSPGQKSETREYRNAGITLWARNIPQTNSQQIQMPPLPGATAPSQGGHTGPAASNSSKQECPDWDTYVGWDENKLAQRKFDAGPQISNGLAANLAAMKRGISLASPSPSRAPKPNLRQPTPSPRSPQQNEAKFASQSLTPGSPTKPAMKPQFNPLEENGAQLPPHLRSGRQMGPLQEPLVPHRTESAPLSFSDVVRVPAVAVTTSSTILPVNSVVLPNHNSSTNLPAATPHAKERCLLDDDIHNQSLSHAVLQPNRRPHERQQSADEVSTRSFQNTMRQLAGKPKRTPFTGRLGVPEWPQLPSKKTEPAQNVDSVDPLPDFINDIDQAFHAMVTILRGFRGDLEVRVDFGRIVLRYFHQKQLSDKEGDRVITHDAAMVRRMLFKPTSVGPTAHFTNVLTTKLEEMSCVLAIKDRAGSLLWEQKVAGWNVTYEFTFLDKNYLSNNRFTIEINAESFITQIKTKQELGNIYVHGTKRHNDFRIAATGFEIHKTEERYSPLLTALEKSLWVPASKPKPEIYWVLERALLQQFDLEDLTVRRVSNHKAKNGKAILKISELQSLDIQGAWMSGFTACVFYGVPGPERKPYEKLNTWHEVSISSIQANEAFDVNKKLELGEEAAWAAESISDAAWDMCSPACEMLKQIDALGWEDENSIPIQDTKNRVHFKKEGQSAASKHQKDNSFW